MEKKQAYFYYVNYVWKQKRPIKIDRIYEIITANNKNLEKAEAKRLKNHLGMFLTTIKKGRRTRTEK